MSEGPSNDIHGRIDEMTRNGPKPRLISIFAADRRDGTFDLIYAFHDGDEVHDIRYIVKADEEQPSLSDQYIGAICMEREVVDMFGLQFKGIVGGFLLDPEKSPRMPLRLPPKEVAKNG
jgi:NADH:ubiquinone oxidoreductase subunit C